MDTLVRKCRAALCKEERPKPPWDPRAAPLGSQTQGRSRGATWLDVGSQEQLAGVGRVGFTQATPVVTFGLGAVTLL